MKLLGDLNEQLDIITSVNWVWNITTVNIFSLLFCVFTAWEPPWWWNRKAKQSHYRLPWRSSSNIHFLFKGALSWLAFVFKYSRTSMCDHLSRATTSHKRPPFQNTQIFPVKVLKLEPSSERPPSVSDRDFLWEWWLMISYSFQPLVSDHLTHSPSLFSLCALLLRIYEEL